MNTTNNNISEMSKEFTKVHNKLNKLEKRSVDFGTGEKLFASELHTIEAIGKKRATTATGLCNLFAITKGAVSQIISRLEEKNYVSRERNRDHGKNIDISLTEKGWKVFEAHEELHKRMDKELLIFMKTVSEDQIEGFIKILNKIEKYVDKFLAE